MNKRDELQTMLDRLDAGIAERLRDGLEPDAFWPAFATDSDPVLKAAGPDDFDWVSSQIDDMLRRHGIPLPEA